MSALAVNGVALDAARWPSPELAAVHELLRQRAFELGLADDAADEAACAAAIEQLLAREVQVPQPTREECLRFYQATPQRWRSGELVHARHILLRVGPGAPVADIREVAESMLRQLRGKPDLFEACAQRNSNCPSGAQGGQLGQLRRGDTVPEFERALFDGEELGILPRLVNTRYGFHIVAVDQRIPGEQLPFELVADRVALALRATTERRALAQYVRVLAGQAELEGVDIDAAASPLVQ